MAKLLFRQRLEIGTTCNSLHPLGFHLALGSQSGISLALLSRYRPAHHHYLTRNHISECMAWHSHHSLYRFCVLAPFLVGPWIVPSLQGFLHGLLTFSC